MVGSDDREPSWSRGSQTRGHTAPSRPPSRTVPSVQHAPPPFHSQPALVEDHDEGPDLDDGAFEARSEGESEGEGGGGGESKGEGGGEDEAPPPPVVLTADSVRVMTDDEITSLPGDQLGVARTLLVKAYVDIKMEQDETTEITIKAACRMLKLVLNNGRESRQARGTHEDTLQAAYRGKVQATE